MNDAMTLTYQSRLPLDERQQEIFSKYATLFNHVEHSLYAEIAKGKTSAACKSDFLKKYGITARQFNACRINLEGKIAACKASMDLAAESLRGKIALIEKQIQKLDKKSSKRLVLHQKKRRKEHLIKRLSFIEEDCKKRCPPLCFGGKKLFRAQFYLEQNGFSTHQEWKEAWRLKRNSEFFILGSKDETAGNQTCTAIVQEEGRFTLRLRLPDALIKEIGTKYVEIENVSFKYGKEAILASLNNPDGQALSYRFKKDHKGWIVFVSTDLKRHELVSKEGNGVIGIDLNSDHIAYVETDRFGNPIKKEVIPWISHGKTRNQLKAATGDICKHMIEKAKETRKPIVIEKLDFKKKKLALREESSPAFARLLSSFAYGLFFLFLAARAFKHGIAIYQVNPAFTSIIGRINYAKRYGLSVHLAAALCIARRYQKFSESPGPSVGEIPDGKGGYVAFVLPERNRTKHVWHFWGQVKKKIKAELAAHYRAMKNRSLSPQFGS
jgi:IS605 OrfB family transposase